MHTYALTDETGQIMQVVNGPYRYIKCTGNVMDNTHYADEAGVIHEKRPLTFDETVDGLTLTLSGLPAGLRATTNGMDTVTDDEPLVIEYDVPGTYEIKLSGHVAYLDRVEEVTIGEP